MGPYLFLLEHLLDHANVGIKIRLLGTSNSMNTLSMFFPWCKPKWLWDEFKVHS